MSISESYDKWAKNYDQDSNKTRDLDQLVTKKILSNYAFSNVLELGCGTGKNSSWLLSKAKRLTGLDFSQEMLAIAKEKVMSEQANFIQTDLTQKWPVADGSADLLTSCLVLEHLEDLNHIFEEAERVLRSGGFFFISEYHPAKQYEGKKARFEQGETQVEIDAFVHHVTDFTDAAFGRNFRLVEMKEWFDEEDRSGIPRIISFVFQK